MTAESILLDAMDLVLKRGFWDGGAPDEVAFRFYDLEKAEPLFARNPHTVWNSERLLHDLVFTLLLPIIPLELDVYEIGSHNPIRTRRVSHLQAADSTWDTAAEDTATAIMLLTPYSVDVPVDIITDYIRHRGTWVQTSDPTDLLVGLHLGMTPSEVRTGMDTGTLTADGLRVMHALVR